MYYSVPVYLNIDATNEDVVEKIMKLTYATKSASDTRNMSYDNWANSPNGKKTRENTIKIVKKDGENIKKQGVDGYFKSQKGANLLNALTKNSQTIVDLFVGSKEAWEGEPVYEEKITEKKWLGMNPITVVLLAVPITIVLGVIVYKLVTYKK